MSLNNRKLIFIVLSDAVFYSIFFCTQQLMVEIVSASNISYPLKHKQCLSIEKYSSEI